MKKTIRTLLTIGKYIALFLLFYILSLIFVSPIINIFYSRSMIKDPLATILIFTIPTLISIAIITIIIFTNKKNKNNWFKTISYFKFYILFLIIAGLGSSIKKELELTIDNAKFLITTEWSLFAILLAMLITWCVLVDKEIKYSKEKTGKVFGLNDRLEILKNNQISIINSQNYFWNIIPCLLSLISLSTATNMILVGEESNLFTQSLLLFNIYLLTNSIVLILMDILAPTIIKLFNIKRQKITNSEFQSEIVDGLLEDKVLEEFEELIGNNPSSSQLTDEEKKKVIAVVFSSLKPEIEKMKSQIYSEANSKLNVTKKTKNKGEQKEKNDGK